VNKTHLALMPILFAFGCGSADGGGPAPAPESPAAATAESEHSVADVKDSGPKDSGPFCSFGAPAEFKECHPDLELWRQAKKGCEGAGTFINDFTANESCGPGSSNDYTVVCCSEKPSCPESGGSGGPKCTTDEEFFTSAEESCSGGGIADFSVTRDKCAEGSGKGDTFTCGCM
jgi:hypothetical protein